MTMTITRTVRRKTRQDRHQANRKCCGVVHGAVIRNTCDPRFGTSTGRHTGIRTTAAGVRRLRSFWLCGRRGLRSPALWNACGTGDCINGGKKAGIAELLLVGGAGSLEVKPGVQAVGLPGFPAEYKQGALATRETLSMLRKESTLDWSFLPFRRHLSGPTDRHVSARFGSAIARCDRKEPHLARRLCGGHG